MSEYKFNTNQSVQVTADHNHIAASEQVYKVGSIDRISGAISVQLLHDGKCIGALPESKLKAV
jgi:hypothetical protein